MSDNCEKSRNSYSAGNWTQQIFLRPHPILSPHLVITPGSECGPLSSHLKPSAQTSHASLSFSHLFKSSFETHYRESPSTSEPRFLFLGISITALPKPEKTNLHGFKTVTTKLQHTNRAQSDCHTGNLAQQQIFSNETQTK